MELTKSPENRTDLWTPDELGRSTYEPSSSKYRFLSDIIAN